MAGPSADASGINLRARLESEVLVCDGAVGTMFESAGISGERCRPELSVSRPDLVRAIHRGYVAAGADMIETNTFGANRVALARFGLEDHVARINAAAVALAREVCGGRGSGILVAGSIGPAASPRRTRSVSRREAVDALVEQVIALDEAGVDLLIFETFGDLAALVDVVDATRGVSSLEVIAQVTFLDDGRTISGDPPDAVAPALEDLEVAALGANCTIGPRGMRTVIDELASATSLPLSIQPNAGPPTIVHGHFQYQQNEEYFARAARHFVELGASIVGGCCGTTPRHVEAIAQAVRGLRPGQRRAERRTADKPSAVVEGRAPEAGRFRSKLAGGEFVLGCELRLPEGSDPDAAVAEVGRLAQSGVDAVVIAPTGSSRTHISPVTFGLLVTERLGIDAVLTQTTFDKSVLALQADLLGAHAFGLQSVICRTGTPLPEGDYPSLSGVFEVTSIDLIGMLRSLNEARDHLGTRLRRATSFLIGAHVNPLALDLAEEIEQTRAKIGAGAHFLVTEPVFDVGDLRRFLDELGDCPRPLLLGVTALRDFEHAEYLRYEVPGMRVPDSVLARLWENNQPETGLRIASELVWEAAALVKGVVAVPATGSADEGVALIAAILGAGEPWRLTSEVGGEESRTDAGDP